MEFSQSRLNGAQGAKPTHDFLSLYSPAQQDPTPTIPDDYRKTHDFLQPLEEEVGRNVAKSKSKSFPRTVEHSLPGGMGTYSMNHIPYMNNQIQTQKVSKNDQGIVISSGAKSSSSNNNDENSNSSSYTGSGFTLWEDSNILNKGKTGKENDVGIKHMIKDGGGVPWMTSSIHNHPTTTFTSLSSSHSHPSNNRYFADTLKFGKSPQQELDDDDDQVFVIKKEPAFHHKAVKVDCGQKPNSPRSKHSATEQRRRSKINDRFSMLRGIIPHGDQKRDKASFLLEVIEYIQFLQEKVHKYEDSGQGWTDQPANNILSNNFRDQPMRSVDATNQQPAGSDTHISTHDTTTDCIITSDKLKDEQLIIESGTISISTTYSQGLSSALTQALKSSGVDLSQANISVQIDLGNGSNNPSPPDLKENETVSIDQSSGEGFKRLKTNRQ